MTTRPNQSAAANGLSAVRSSVAGVRERAVRSTAAPEAVAAVFRYAWAWRSFRVNAKSKHEQIRGRQ